MVRGIVSRKAQHSGYNLSAMKMILLLAVLLTIVQTSPPSPKQTADNSNPTTSNVKNDKQNNETPPHDNVTAVKTPANRPSQGNRDQQTETNPEHSVGISKLPVVSVEPDYGMYAFSGLLVIVGAIQVWLLYRTWGQNGTSSRNHGTPNHSYG